MLLLLASCPPRACYQVAAGEFRTSRPGRCLGFCGVDTCTTCFRPRSADEHKTGGHAFTGAPLPVDEPPEPPPIDTGRMVAGQRIPTPEERKVLDQVRRENVKRVNAEREAWLLAKGMAADTARKRPNQPSRLPEARHRQYLKNKLRRAMARESLDS